MCMCIYGYDVNVKDPQSIAPRTHISLYAYLHISISRYDVNVKDPQSIAPRTHISLYAYLYISISRYDVNVKDPQSIAPRTGVRRDQLYSPYEQRHALQSI